MKTTLNLVPTPSSTCFTMFAEPDFELLRETKTVTVSFHPTTKTRLSTSLSFGDFRNNINLNIEGYKLFEKTSMSYASYKNVTSHYFVKSKKQNAEVYQKYVVSLVEHIIKDVWKLDLDELNINLQGMLRY